MKPEPKNFRRLSFAVPAGFNVDAAAGVLRNLVMLAGDREAKGHGLYIDAETIRTAHACAAARKQLKGAMRHLSWEDYFATGGDRVLDFPGWFEDFSIEKAQLVAGKFEFYETFRTDPATAPAYARIMEIAGKTPDLIGLSIEAWGYAVFVAKDGQEYGIKPDGVELLYDGVPALRVTDLFFAAFVDEPAATDGLFAKFAAVFSAKRRLPLAASAELDAALDAWASAHLGSGGEVLTPTPNRDHAPDFSSTMKIIAELKAKFTDPARFAAAMSVVGNTPADKLAALTVADVEAQLVAVDLAAATKRVETLTAELATATNTVAAVTKERDDWKTKYETLKASGKPASVGLGAPTSSPSATTVNPWLKESLNLTEQVRLTKSDPALAAQLKAAAGK